jgi:hypothetical protein
MPQTLQALESERAELLAQLAQTGDMRRGSISEAYRRCGKAGCHCGGPRDPGHGPFFAFTRKVGGKTETLQLRAGPQLTKLQREVESYRVFRALSERLLAVNEAICKLRPGQERGEADTAQS